MFLATTSGIFTVFLTPAGASNMLLCEFLSLPVLWTTDIDNTLDFIYTYYHKKFKRHSIVMEEYAGKIHTEMVLERVVSRLYATFWFSEAHSLALLSRARWQPSPLRAKGPIQGCTHTCLMGMCWDGSWSYLVAPCHQCHRPEYTKVHQEPGLVDCDHLNYLFMVKSQLPLLLRSVFWVGCSQTGGAVPLW